ncbi:MAG: DNA-processing protein DprA [Steroidobacteraceae bacterium]|jgi:DNA processing protein|nr:DNA-processing protein DprA [Steroidobacteraceae bacterium]
MDAIDLRAWALLARCPALTADTLVEPLAAAGHAAAVIADAQRLLPANAARRLALAHAEVDADLAWLGACATRRLVPCTHPDYPPLLRSIADAPVALWVEGRVDALARAQIAVVGTRRPTPTGRELARGWSRAFADAGYVVASGLAAGIDAEAHRGALESVAPGAVTLAVCGTGLANPYPAAHAGLAAQIATRGAVVSEFPPHAGARPANFPRRNRIISGLALGTLVVEAASRSGSLITARLAGEQGREVYAVPGSVLNPVARGCHALLRQGARLVESAAEVVEELARSPLEAVRTDARPAPDDTARATGITRPRLDKQYEMLLDALGFEPADVDTLADRTGLAAQAVSSMLLILELQGRVEPRAGRFCRALTAGPDALDAGFTESLAQGRVNRGGASP